MTAVSPAFLQPPLVLSSRSRLRAPQRRLRNCAPKCVIEQFNDFTIEADFKTPYASGSFGDVFIGTIQPNNQRVVLKRARNSSIARTLFDKERSINRKLHGIPDSRPRHWPRFLGDYVRDSQYFLVWDLEGDGATLASYLSGRPPSALANALGVSSLPGLQVQTFRQVLTHLLLAVGHLHARGIVHRDVKPDNILVIPNSPSTSASPNAGAFPPLRLIDFGSGCDVGGLFWTRGIHTLDPLYAAPEERLNLVAPKKFDLFSIGMIAVSVLMPSFADPSRLREFRNTLEASDFDLNAYRAKYLAVTANRNSSSFALRDELDTLFTSTDENISQAFAVLSGLLKKSPMERSSVEAAFYKLGYSEVPTDS